MTRTPLTLAATALAVTLSLAACKRDEPAVTTDATPPATSPAPGARR